MASMCRVSSLSKSTTLWSSVETATVSSPHCKVNTSTKLFVFNKRCYRLSGYNWRPDCLINSNAAARPARPSALVKAISLVGASRSATDHLGDPFLPESVQIRWISCFNLVLMSECLEHWKKKWYESSIPSLLSHIFVSARPMWYWWSLKVVSFSSSLT